LPYLKLVRGFRSGYAYDNSLYLIAGLLLERVAGIGWDEYVTTRLFAPLGMVDAASNPTRPLSADRAGRHSRLGPPVIGVGPLKVVTVDESAILGPAGGINVSLAGAVPWLKVQLARGALPDGRRLWSEAQAEQMWTPQTITASGSGPTSAAPQRSVIRAYALGWGVSDFRGRRMLSHAGGLIGQATLTSLLPDDGLALVVFSNSEEEEALSMLRYAIFDRILGAPAFDWLALAQSLVAARQAETLEKVGRGMTPPPGGPSLPLAGYVGRYRDPWYGDVVVSPRFAPQVGEDAVVAFAVRAGAVAAVSMRALSPLADFSYDYQDLAFTPVLDGSKA
jgi:CubicO group peptidase (beta-lactamase class C family)